MGMIEKVARAIYEAQHDAGPLDDEPINWGRGGYATQVMTWHAAARAAIAAMREPDGAMVIAGEAAGGKAWEYTGSTVVCHPSRSFPAMIDAALEEG